MDPQREDYEDPPRHQPKVTQAERVLVWAGLAVAGLLFVFAAYVLRILTQL